LEINQAIKPAKGSRGTANEHIHQLCTICNIILHHYIKFTQNKFVDLHK